MGAHIVLVADKLAFETHNFTIVPCVDNFTIIGLPTDCAGGEGAEMYVRSNKSWQCVSIEDSVNFLSLEECKKFSTKGNIEKTTINKHGFYMWLDIEKHSRCFNVQAGENGDVSFTIINTPTLNKMVFNQFRQYKTREGETSSSNTESGGRGGSSVGGGAESACGGRFDDSLSGRISVINNIISRNMTNKLTADGEKIEVSRVCEQIFEKSNENRRVRTAALREQKKLVNSSGSATSLNDSGEIPNKFKSLFCGYITPFNEGEDDDVKLAIQLLSIHNSGAKSDKMGKSSNAPPNDLFKAGAELH